MKESAETEYEKLADRRQGECSAAVRARVERARALQGRRYGDGRLNSELGPGEVRRYCRLDESGESLMRAAMRQLQLARTIADLEGSERISSYHSAEAPPVRHC